MVLVPFHLLDSYEAMERYKLQAHLAGHETAQATQTQVVAVGFPQDLLCCIEGIQRQRTVGTRNKGDVLHTRELKIRLGHMVSRRIKHRSLKHRPTNAGLFVELLENKLQLVSL